MDIWGSTQLLSCHSPHLAPYSQEKRAQVGSGAPSWSNHLLEERAWLPVRGCWQSASFCRWGNSFQTEKVLGWTETQNVSPVWTILVTSQGRNQVYYLLAVFLNSHMYLLTELEVPLKGRFLQSPSPMTPVGPGSAKHCLQRNTTREPKTTINLYFIYQTELSLKEILKEEVISSCTVNILKCSLSLAPPAHSPANLSPKRSSLTLNRRPPPHT